ncbi:hypothetical protein [Streptomyces sp. NRRL F-5053]|uniref:hypothetical protein n=1 Tax=Streptomyces sp. NRRL F-5053 TaxID=1463854 RepID=UPI0004C52503|nr:hypothetical protein [Streptomyces sp. NRRL F-5053]
MSDPTTTLPDREEIIRRLRQVHGEPHLSKHFYPAIAASSGERLTGRGIAMVMRLAVADYITEDMPPQMALILERLLPEYVQALIDAPDVQAAALAAIRESRA